MGAEKKMWITCETAIFVDGVKTGQKKNNQRLAKKY
jgi:hypothetical protein